MIGKPMNKDAEGNTAMYAGWGAAGRPSVNSGTSEQRGHKRIAAAAADLLDEVPPYREWMPFAACKGTDPELWHPSKGPPPLLHLCADCPVRRECFTTGVLTGQMGTWGGSSERLREDVRISVGLTGGMQPVDMVLAPARAMEIAQRNKPEHAARQPERVA